MHNSVDVGDRLPPKCVHTRQPMHTGHTMSTKQRKVIAAIRKAELAAYRNGK
jgi:hypothetical protein